MSSKPRFVDFRDLKQRVTIREILGHYGWLDQLRGQGDRLSGPCPICDSGGNSLRVSQEKNCFKCFRCEAAGNILDFVAGMEDCSIRESALQIAEWFRIETARPSKKRSNPRRGRSKRVDDDAAEVDQPDPETTEPSTPTPESRNLPEANIPLTFELKLDPEHPWFEEVGLTPETVKEFGLGYCSKGLMRDRIAFPIHNLNGELVAYAGLWIGEDPDEGQVPWKYPKDFRADLAVFNLHRVWQQELAETVMIAADPLEAVHWWQSGGRHVVCLCGPAFSSQTAELLGELIQNG
jgi:DNA primase